MPAPANDTRAAAQLLAGGSGSDSGTLVDATGEGTFYGAAWRDVWYYWSGLSARTIKVDYDVDDPGTYLEVSFWASAPAAAGETSPNTQIDWWDNTQPRSLEIVHPGGDLTLSFACHVADSEAFTFSWETTTPPTNDARVDAEELTGNDGTVVGSTEGADGDTGTVYGDPWHVVWYYWADKDPGPVTITAIPDRLDCFMEISLWAEAAAGAATNLDNFLGNSGIGDPGDPPAHQLTVDFPGGVLTLAVATYFSTTTGFTLDWSDTPAAWAAVGQGVWAAAPLVPASGADFGAVGRGVFTATSPPRGRRWRAVVTDAFGTVHGELPDAVIGPITDEENTPEQWQVTLLQNDPAVDLLHSVPFREVQVWRGDQLLAWGPAVRAGFDQDRYVIDCRGAGWHLTRRAIGKADRRNYVENGSFEDDLAGWSPFANPVAVAYGWPGAQTVGPAASIVTFPTVLGRKALSLQNFVAGCDAGLYQTFQWTVDESANPDGDLFTLVGYVYVPSPIPAGQAAGDGRGLYLERFSTTQLNPDPNVQAVIPGARLSLQHSFAHLDEDTPTGTWQRMEVALTTPPKANEPEIVNVRLYAPAGLPVYWDAVSLTRVETLAFYGADQATIVAGIVAHLQDAAYDKSDANITADCPLTGVLRTRVYVHHEHPSGIGAIEEFTRLDNGMDFSIDYTPTRRFLRTHYPSRGTYKPAYGLTLPTTTTPGNVSKWSLALDGERASTTVIVLGTSGSGSGREEGVAVDTSGWSDGVTLEEVFAAPPETPIDSLDNMAAARLAAARSPYTLTVQTTPTAVEQSGLPDPVGAVRPGDLLPVAVSRHVLDIAGVWRVARIVTDPATGTVTYTLNPADEATV